MNAPDPRGYTPIMLTAERFGTSASRRRRDARLLRSAPSSSARRARRERVRRARRRRVARRAARRRAVRAAVAGARPAARSGRAARAQDAHGRTPLELAAGAGDGDDARGRERARRERLALRARGRQALGDARARERAQAPRAGRAPQGSLWRRHECARASSSVGAHPSAAALVLSLGWGWGARVARLVPGALRAAAREREGVRALPVRLLGRLGLRDRADVLCALRAPRVDGDDAVYVLLVGGLVRCFERASRGDPGVVNTPRGARLARLVELARARATRAAPSAATRSRTRRSASRASSSGRRARSTTRPSARACAASTTSAPSSTTRSARRTTRTSSASSSSACSRSAST